MAGAWRRREMAAGGFTAGTAVGASIGWLVGYYAWVVNPGGLAWGILFLASFLLGVVGLVAPLALVRFSVRPVDRTGGTGRSLHGR